MDRSQKAQFDETFQNLMALLTDPENFRREDLTAYVAVFCEMFHIAKGVTEFYRSLSAEKDGQGEVFSEYDNGHADKVALYKRYVTKTQAVIITTLYIAEDEPMLSEEDLRKVDLVMRCIQSFISRNRLQKTVEQFVFHDSDDYPNVNAFTRFIDRLNDEGKLTGKTVINYNFKHFTMVNQDIGRKSGDLVIRNHFNTVRNIIGDKGFVCRVRGDSFLAIFDTSEAKSIIDRIANTTVIYDNDREKRIMVSSYIGVYEIGDDFVFERAEDILTRVFAAASDAKSGSTDSISYYDESRLAEKEHDMRIHHLLPSALRNDEFKIYYQPKVDINTGEVVGAEALCRWFHDGVLIPPSDFIPILEQNTDICSLDFRILDLVCRDIHRWLLEGKPSIRISVNLSRKHLMDVDLVNHILRIIDDNDVPHENIEIELTETTTDVEFKDLKRVAAALREKGIMTSVDDFGMGYSSLNLIREIPWDVLKIDKCFLPSSENLDNRVTDLMYSHVVAMALEMGLECVTEGVETLEQVKTLRKNNCRVAQGFFFDKPLPVNEFEAKLGGHPYSVS
ncbi:MAG: GGDEF domain-containing protein [Lachnospiraceae bacterium]|nr:GGDEF domain-containing protein [Lachnospiraceae bacterium]